MYVSLEVALAVHDNLHNSEEFDNNKLLQADKFQPFQRQLKILDD